MTTQMNVLGDMEVRNLKLEIRQIKAEIEWLEDAIARRNARAERTRNVEMVGDRFRNRTFENFDETAQPKAYGICKRYAENFNTLRSAEKNSLVLMGNCGTGKTHLVASITNVLIDRGIEVLYGTYADHLNRIKAEFGKGGNYLEQMQTCPLLVVDDYGKEKEGEWTDEIWYSVINARYERMLPIIITTNLSALEFLNSNGNAVQSRLGEMAVTVKVEGKDWRRNGLSK